MNIVKIREIFNNNSEKFLSNIKSMKNNKFSKWYIDEKSNINMFLPANEEFFKYLNFEKYLECQIYNYLINRNLYDLFLLYGINFYIPNRNIRIEKKSYFFGLLKKDIETETMFVNETVENAEQRFLCEFIIEDNGERIGYRYTTVVSNNINKELKKYKLSKIFVLDMRDQDDSKRLISYGVEEKYRHLVPSIKFSIFFTNLFGKDIYNLYITEVLSVIKKANEIIGFQTVPNMSFDYVSDFKDKVSSNLLNHNYENIHYEVINKEKLNKKNLEIACKKINNDDNKKLIENFIGKGLYNILLSDEDFARSFVTSEYLYEVFKNKNNMDNTWIICGYVKCVEQLLHKFLKLELENTHDQQLWIKGNNKMNRIISDKSVCRINPNNNNHKVYQVIVDKKNEEYFDTSLAPLLNFVIDNKSGWIVSIDTFNTISELLRIYSQEDRNEHFHKDNIYSFKTVEKIRNNTIYVLYLLLGAYKIALTAYDNGTLVGYNNDYEKLCKKILEIPSGCNKYYLVFKDREYKAILLNDKKDVVFDANGKIISDLRFIREDNFVISDYEKFVKNAKDSDYIIVNANNMPKIVYLRFRDNSRKDIFKL